MQPDDALEFHPLAMLFPPLDDAAFEALKEDIREHGLREPITVFENKILDGIHRYKACLAVGVAPRFRDYEGGSPLAFVLGLNLRRRHLTTTQGPGSRRGCRVVVIGRYRRRGPIDGGQAHPEACGGR